MKNKDVLITIVYDNRTIGGALEASHGFACVVQKGGKTILFDTGSRVDILLSNMKHLGFSPKDIDTVFISHSHWDHTGGLFGLLAKNKRLKVYAPDSFSGPYKNEISAACAGLTGIKEFKEISDGIYSSGELGREIKEQALIIDTKKGLIVITGCSHPGIVNIIHRARTILKKEIYLIVGGLHLYPESKDKLGRTIKDIRAIGVYRIAPCHCTGEKALKALRAAFSNGFVEAKVGSKIF